MTHGSLSYGEREKMKILRGGRRMAEPEHGAPGEHLVQDVGS